MSVDDIKEKTGPAAEMRAKHAKETAQTYVPTVNEIHDPNRSAKLEKKHAASGGTTLSTTKARQGVVVAGMRYVLGISLVLVILAMILTYTLAFH
jgi:hypothetical protein